MTSVAVDWLAANLYYLSSDGRRGQLEVSRLDGGFRKLLPVHFAALPASLALYPQKG